MELKGKTILSLRVSERTRKEYFTINVSSKGKDDEYHSYNIIANIKDSEKYIKNMKSKGVGALLIEITDAWLNVNTYEYNKKEFTSLSVFINEFKVVDSYKKKDKDTDLETPF